MLPPLPRCSSRASSSLISPGHVSLPRKRRRVGLHIVLFEACSAFTRVAACPFARSPIRDPLPEGFSHFVTSMTAPVASGWSNWPGGALTHWKAPPCHGAPSRPTLDQDLTNERSLTNHKGHMRETPRDLRDCFHPPSHSGLSIWPSPRPVWRHGSRRWNTGSPMLPPQVPICS
jgi:hypothetical protein